ncbi:MAG: DUF2238 domain-containing protein [Actinomycetota bacterium]|nr:DUF2238 domain-containing protein [Actinomycetota bacterium]
MTLIREHTILAAFSIGYLIAFTTSTIVRGRSEGAIYFAVTFTAMLVVAWTYRRFRYSTWVLWGLSVWALSHMAGGLIPVGDDVLYQQQVLGDLVRYDQAVHAFGFGFATLACAEVLSSTTGNAGVTLAILAALAGLGLGAINEVFEFASARIQEHTNVGGYANTGGDLSFNLLGAGVAALTIMLTRRPETPTD